MCWCLCRDQDVEWLVSCLTLFSLSKESFLRLTLTHNETLFSAAIERNWLESWSILLTQITGVQHFVFIVPAWFASCRDWPIGKDDFSTGLQPSVRAQTCFTFRVWIRHEPMFMFDTKSSILLWVLVDLFGSVWNPRTGPLLPIPCFTTVTLASKCYRCCEARLWYLFVTMLDRFSWYRSIWNVLRCCCIVLSEHCNRQRTIMLQFFTPRTYPTGSYFQPIVFSHHMVGVTGRWAALRNCFELLIFSSVARIPFRG